MKKILFLGLLLAPSFAVAQSSVTADTLQMRQLDAVIISATRASSDAPVAQSQVEKAQLERVAPSQNVPFALALTPGAVAVGENGTGSGYAYLRIRGSEGSRIQVTLNGITINDAESQEVFWVNLPSLSGFLQNVQVQRGLGTSDNGSGAFGATVSMQTQFVSPDPYVHLESSYGSYHTWNQAVGVGTGVGTSRGEGHFMPKGLSAEVRYAHGSTAGYVRNGKGNLHSLNGSLSFVRPTYALRLLYLYGEQHTGITWEGISRDMLTVDRRSNPAGAYYDNEGRLCYYNNETDNYVQHHVQGNYLQHFGNRFVWSTTAHFTKGDGYYENYKENGAADYIVRRSMDNAYYAFHSLLHYQEPLLPGLSADLSAHYSAYLGNHFGLLSDAYTDAHFAHAQEYYRNTGDKYESGAYMKVNYRLEWPGDVALKAYADMQYRHVSIFMEGPDNDGAALDYRCSHSFFNPKAGVTVSLRNRHQWIASAALGHREASRSDIKESIKAGRAHLLLPERMWDFEVGYRYKGPRWLLGVQGYAMEYTNQLVPTGKKSDTGYEIKENVPVSYRRGVELEGGWQPVKWMQWEGNACFSTNKINRLTVFLDTYDNTSQWNPVVPQMTEYYEKTDLIYSPSFTGMAQVTFRPFSTNNGPFAGFECALWAQWVGKQYYDNTSSESRSLPAYHVLGLSAKQPFTTPRWGTFELSVFVDNLLNAQYCANAWVYRAAFRDTGTQYISEGFFPQAGIHAMVKLAWRWN